MNQVFRFKFPAYIAAEHGLHEAVRLTFRPMTSIEIEQLDQLEDESSTKEDFWDRIKPLETIAAKIVEWDWDNGKPVRGESLATLQPLLCEKVVALVRGERENDPDPEEITEPITSAKFLDDSQENLVLGLRLKLWHPAVARVSCSECKEFWFNPEKGQFEKRAGERLKRPVDAPLPCSSCPKGSPEKEKFSKLTLYNLKTLEIYFTHRATNWAAAALLLQDEIFCDNVRIIDRIIREYEREQQAKEFVRELRPLAVLLAGKKINQFTGV
jgi:hypothetical protein